MTVTEERKAAEAWIIEAGPYHGCSMPIGGHLFELYVSCFLAGAAWQREQYGPGIAKLQSEIDRLIAELREIAAKTSKQDAFNSCDQADCREPRCLQERSNQDTQSEHEDNDA